MRTVPVCVKKPAKKTPVPTVSLAPCVPGQSGCVAWKMHGRHAVAYVSDAAIAALLLNTDVKNVAKHAMAVYYDRKGKAFAYQVRFASERWDEVVARLG